MSFVAKLALNRTESSDDTQVPTIRQEANIDDSEASDNALIDIEKNPKKETLESDDKFPAEEIINSREPDNQVSEFGQLTSTEKEAEKIITDIFTRTKISVSADDPLVIMIQMIRQEFIDAQSDMKSFVFASMMDSLSMYTKAVQNEIKAMHNDHAQIIAEHTEAVQEATGQALADFDKQVDETVKRLVARLDEIKQTTEVLGSQKQFIVNDVYGKLNEKILTEVKGNLIAELKRIANNENNEVNKQKNMLIGTLAGLFFGMILAVLIVLII